MPIRMMMRISIKEYAKAHGLVERTLGEYFSKKKTNDLFVKNNICITFAIGNKPMTTV